MTSILRLLKPTLGVLCQNSLTPVIQPSRQLKSALKIKWVRPERVPCILPEQSGDLETLGVMEMTEFPTPYKASKELESASEIVKRIHTLEFFPRKVLKEEFFLAYSNRVKAHRLDDSSPEVRIALLTAKIRNLQVHYAKNQKDIINKVRLKEFIDRRNKYLRWLRHTDYKKFEWLLEKLNITYKQYLFGDHERVERKRSLRRLTALYIEKLKAERLAEYKTFLEAQKENFLKEKLDKFIWMKKTEEECGGTPSITDDDIEAIRKQLQDYQLNKTVGVTEGEAVNVVVNKPKAITEGNKLIS